MASAFKVFTSNAVGTAPVPVGTYTVGANTQTTVIGMSIANITASPINVTAQIATGNTYTRIVKDAPVPVGSSLVIVGGDQKIVLTSGYRIDVISSAASSADVILSVLEVT